MLIVRSLLFNILFYCNIILWALIGLPCFILPRAVMRKLVVVWARSNLFLMRIVVGTKVEFRGAENIPQGSLLVAAKHQSLWETFALLVLFDDVAFVLKRELTWIPLFGWCALKAGMIPIDRRGSVSAIKKMTVEAKQAIKENRQFLIFPEGTRRAPGAEAAYKSGANYLYRQLKTPCLPVALNSGLFWPRRQFMRYPGTIVVEVLPVIAPGLSQEVFAEKLEETIETASLRLWQEGLRSREAAL